MDISTLLNIFKSFVENLSVELINPYSLIKLLYQHKSLLDDNDITLLIEAIFVKLDVLIELLLKDYQHLDIINQVLEYLSSHVLQFKVKSTQETLSQSTISSIKVRFGAYNVDIYNEYGEVKEFEEVVFAAPLTHFLQGKLNQPQNNNQEYYITHMELETLDFLNKHLVENKETPLEAWHSFINSTDISVHPYPIAGYMIKMKQETNNPIYLVDEEQSISIILNPYKQYLEIDRVLYFKPKYLTETYMLLFTTLDNGYDTKLICRYSEAHEKWYFEVREYEDDTEIDGEIYRMTVGHYSGTIKKDAY